MSEVVFFRHLSLHVKTKVSPFQDEAVAAVAAVGEEEAEEEEEVDEAEEEAHEFCTEKRHFR